MNKDLAQKDIDYAALILRLTLGTFFIVAGMAQLLEISGFAQTVSGFAIVPGDAAAAQGLAATLQRALIPWVEIILGLMLFFGLATSVVAVVVAFLAFVFAASRSFVDGGSIAKEILFVAVGLALMLMGGGRMSVDGHLRDRINKK